MIRALLSGLLLATLPLQANERIVMAEVVDVRPITQQRTISPEGCDDAKPDRNEGIAARLRWDLSARCVPRKERVVTGYEATVVWAGREYKQHTKEQPGDRLPIRLSFSVAER